MHCYLINLPAELHLTIVEELLRDQDTKTHANDQIEKQDELIIVYHDLINWSCTCSYFRDMIAPYIFKAAKLVNDEESGSSLNAVSKSPNNVHVKELHFIGSFPGIGHGGKAAFSDTEGIFPRSVDALLCDLQRFPSLERLSIEFRNQLAVPFWWEDGMNLSGATETQEQALQAETLVGWRAFMFKTYSALIQNKSPHFKHLEIRQLIWKRVSIFSHAVFHDFLGHFEQFTLSIHGREICEGWMSNTIDQYPTLMGKLDEYFFNHLVNVTTLSIKAPKAATLGLRGWNHAPLALNADQMPLLTTLHLEYVFVSPELIHFLAGHRYTLEQLTLRNCYASPGPPGYVVNKGMCWSEFFSSLFSACPTQLRRFDLVASETSLPSGHYLSAEKDGWRHITLRQHPGKILFPYAFLNKKKGRLRFDEEASFEAFSRGEDQRTWDQLMGLVEGNAEKAARSESKDVEWRIQS